MTRDSLDSEPAALLHGGRRCRRFAAAGEMIGLTRSGISVRVRNLEDRLGRRFFDRTSRSVNLTEDGELLLELFPPHG